MMATSTLKRLMRSLQTIIPTFVATVVWNDTQGRARALWRIVVPLIPLFVLFVIVEAVAFVLIDTLPGPALIFAVQLTVAVVVFVVFTVSTRYLDRGRSIWDYGLRADRQWGNDLLAGFLIGVIAVAIPYLIGIGTGWYEIVAVLSSGPVGLWVGLVLLIMAYLCTGFWEELVYRGVLMANAAEGLRRWLSTRNVIVGGLILQAIIFGSLHSEQWTTQASHPAFVVTWMLSGFMFGLLYLLSNDLALPIGVHAAINTAQQWLFSTAAPAESRTSVIFLVEPVSQSILFGHGGIRMISSILMAGVLGVLWLWYSREFDLTLWTHPAIFVSEQENREK